MADLKNMTDEYLKENYVPDVYQPDVYAIDYQKLKDAGIKFISFDIDDTIAALVDPKPSKTAITLFQNLKKDFELMLITNNTEKKGEKFARKLGIKEHYIGEAEKPRTDYFQKMQEDFGLSKEQMAHVGNSMMNDVAGANSFGITSCLVRDVGKLIAIGHGVKKIVVGKTVGQEMREELKARGLWRKHHKYEKGDQYYQLGETPLYKKSGIS